MKWIIKNKSDKQVVFEVDGHVELENGFLLLCDKDGKVFCGLNTESIAAFWIEGHKV